MPFLSIVSSFDEEFLENSSPEGQDYRVDNYYRCPYITSVWDEIQAVDYEVPLFWYMKNDKKPINEFVETIRMSSITGRKILLDKDREGKFVEDKFMVFKVDKKAIGHEIDSNIVEEILYPRMSIFLDEYGVMYSITKNKMQIIVTLDLESVIWIDKDRISKAIGKEVQEIESVSIKSFNNLFRVCVLVDGNDNNTYKTFCNIYLNVDLNDFKNSEVIIKED